MMKKATAFCLCFTSAHGFVVPVANIHRYAGSSMNVLPPEGQTALSEITLSNLPEEISLPQIPEEFSFPSQVSEVVPFSLPAQVSSFLFGESDVIEEEITNGMTHALLDFSSFWSENAWLIKFLAVIGRIVVLVHSLAHGQEVMPDELAFQLGFLGLSIHSLYQATIPKIEARKASLFMTSKDRLAFRTIFRSAGFSWQQFREINLQSMSWVTVEPGQVILNEAKDDAVFWLYQGDVQIKNEDNKLVHSFSCKDSKGCSMGLLGEKLLASLLDSRQALSEDPNAKSYVAGESGATLLRIDVPKLGNFLKHHDGLTNNFGRLAFIVMQDKLKTLRMKAN